MKCDKCDNEAVFACTDIRETPSDHMRAFEPTGVWRYGCSIHPPEPPKTYNLDGSVDIDKQFEQSVTQIQALYQMKWKPDDQA